MTIDTIDGRILVKIPAGVQTDSRIRVAGKGYRDTHGRRGDFFIKVRIVNPAYLSEELKEDYSRIRSRK
jgi:curved DNA-binding protein